MNKILDPKNICDAKLFLRFIIVQKVFILIFLEPKHLRGPKKLGALGCSLPCLCIKTGVHLRQKP